MAKYNIRKATGRNQNSTSQNKETQSAPQTMSVPSSPIVDGGLSTKDDDLSKSIMLFDTIVTHNYLEELSKRPIVAPSSVPTSKMGWYKITRIVYDGETFFPDQLSMLYTALHHVAHNVALVIDKRGMDDIEIFLGARDFDGYIHESSTLLASAIQGYLPGIKLEQAIDKSFFENNKDEYVASFSGVASLRDDKKESFVQGIEKFIDASQSIPTYTAIFIADNVSRHQANDMIKAYSSLHDAISPFTQCQESISESKTEGVSSTLTKTLGETITDTLSETVTRTEGTNQSYSKGISKTSTYTENESPNFFESMFTKFFGGITGTSRSTANGKQVTEQSGKHVDRSKANGSSLATAKMNQSSDAQGTNTSETSGFTRQITRTNSLAKSYIGILDRHAQRLRNGIPFGLWSIGTYFVSLDSSTSRKLANIYRGCITGEESDLDTTAVNTWGKEDSKTLIQYLRESQNPRFLIGNIKVSSGEVVTSKELAIHMSLPQTSVPGVELRECATFGRNICSRKSFRNNDSDSISIGVISHLGKPSEKKVLLDLEELNKHVFVTGSTGSGKSNTVYLLIDKLMKRGIKMLIVEPTKGDYRKVFGGIEGVTVYSTRESEKNLLKINPFAFPDGIQVVEHVERLVEIFGVCWPMYAAMPAVLKNSILSAYQLCSWDLRKSTCKYGKLFPTIKDVVIQLKRIISSSEYSADTKGDYVGALQTRLESLQNGIYASILCTTDSISYSTLYDQNAIVDLHHIGSSETRSLLMALVVLGLNEWRMSQGEDDMDNKLKHMTVLEEAHNILPRVSKEQNQEGSNMLGKSVEMIADALARMRTYGEGFIIVDQSPSALDESAIRNTNTKIVMNLPDGDDRIIAGKAIALTKEKQMDELAKLSTGEAVVWQRGWSEAVLATIDEMTEKHPLHSVDNRRETVEERSREFSILFTDFFIKQSIELSDNDREKLKHEVALSNSPSCIKAVLYDCINGLLFNKPAKLSKAVIAYANLDEVIKSLFNEYPKGSQNLVWELRDYITTTLGIIDTKVQDKLLSMTFIWASSENEKWHTICTNSLSQINKS